MLDKKFTRRTFLKVSAGAGALVALEGGLPQFDQWKVAQASTPAKVMPSLCEMCGVKCGIMVTVKDGRAVKIDGHPKHPLSNGRLCARGNAGLKTLYDPDRLKQPLKRVGEGRFEPISWEQAFQEIAAKLKELKANTGRRPWSGLPIRSPSLPTRSTSWRPLARRTISAMPRPATAAARSPTTRPTAICPVLTTPTSST
ncbi:MAG: molybdopterin-dependent oxidoreductase [Firmicutes bacterium]|nr:molybdopterin-dependent oxidoreductase [Bacillota bacterium]